MSLQSVPIVCVDSSGSSSPFQSRAPSPLPQQPSPTVVYPYTLRLVPQCQDRAPHDRYFDEVLSNLPSFRPLHPAMAFDDEGE